MHPPTAFRLCVSVHTVCLVCRCALRSSASFLGVKKINFFFFQGTEKICERKKILIFLNERCLCLIFFSAILSLLEVKNFSFQKKDLFLKESYGFYFFKMISSCAFSFYKKKLFRIERELFFAKILLNTFLF